MLLLCHWWWIVAIAIVVVLWCWGDHMVTAVETDSGAWLVTAGSRPFFWVSLWLFSFVFLLFLLCILYFDLMIFCVFFSWSLSDSTEDLCKFPILSTFFFLLFFILHVVLLCSHLSISPLWSMSFAFLYRLKDKN